MIIPGSIPPEGFVRLTCEDGYSLDILAFNSVRVARRVLDQAGAVDAPMRFDYAILDWKDSSIISIASPEQCLEGLAERIKMAGTSISVIEVEEWLEQFRCGPLTRAADRYGDTSGCQLMGFLLGLQARKDNPGCAIVLMSSYPHELGSRFETQWVRDILGDERSNTCDISMSEGDSGKVEVFSLEFLRQCEMKKALEVLTNEPDALAAVFGELSRLSKSVASQPRITRDYKKEEYFKSLDEFKQDEEEWRRRNSAKVGPAPPQESDYPENIEADVRALFLREVEGYILPWLFPFNFALVYQELANRSRLLNKSEDLYLTTLNTFIDQYVSYAYVQDVIGRDIIRQIVPVKVQFRDGSAVCHGLHPSGHEDRHELDAIIAKLPEKIDTLILQYGKTIEEAKSCIFEGLREYHTAIANARKTMTSLYVAQCGNANSLSHKMFRFNPFAILRQLVPSLRTGVEFQFGPGHVTFDMYPAITSSNTFLDSLCGDGFFLLGVKRDVDEALAMLVKCVNMHSEENLKISSSLYFFNEDRVLSGFITFVYNSPFGKANLDNLLSRNGDLGLCLKRLRLYFAVSVGNEHSLASYPSPQPVREFPPGGQTRIQLHFLVLRDHDESIPSYLRRA
jgi:hypothetical protein